MLLEIIKMTINAIIQYTCIEIVPCTYLFPCDTVPYRRSHLQTTTPCRIQYTCKKSDEQLMETNIRLRGYCCSELKILLSNYEYYFLSRIGLIGNVSQDKEFLGIKYFLQLRCLVDI